eukprot:Blabericola_migrator_1__1637@NODE_143_length_13011_cov_100_590389_g17_i3_p4_GENE_NODE_143_length_13011_cov_100_590389_g17_i3NODE_143_length_13011_cov_100_590389_g17_i3_p4_ORF_typecomplete_len409_score59_25Integrin_beta/PF00362_18/1e06Integrin_beta/PF00362_18/1_1e02_NODE_143_length_13011_cov_100_590389_g17_i3531279
MKWRPIISCCLLTLTGASNYLNTGDDAEWSPCKFHVQYFHLHDASVTQPSTHDWMADHIASFLEAASQINPVVEAALGTTVDKPGLGCGASSMWPSYGTTRDDWCYKKVVSFTEDYNMLADELKHLDRGIGVDALQGQYEGLIRAIVDKSVGWLDFDRDYDDEGHPIIRFVAINSNTIPHAAGSYARAANKWVESYGTSSGCLLSAWPETNQVSCLNTAKELALKYKEDPGSLTGAEKMIWEELQVWMGPYNVAEWPGIGWGPHPITYLDPYADDITLEEKDCYTHDYPDALDLVEWFAARRVYPLIVTTEVDPGVEFYDPLFTWDKVATQMGERLGIQDPDAAKAMFRVVLKMDGSDYTDKMSNALEGVGEFVCQRFPSALTTTPLETTMTPSETMTTPWETTMTLL